jgi:hypothetical protein
MAKLTKDEVQKKSQEKVSAIETLCKQLEVVVTAEQMITQQGFIKHVVYYTDVEKYDMVPEEQPNQKPNETKTPTPETAPKAETPKAEEPAPKPTPTP